MLRARTHAVAMVPATRWTITTAMETVITLPPRNCGVTPITPRCSRAKSWSAVLSGSKWDHVDDVEYSDGGQCDTSTEECVCYPGYGGTACQRNVCPNDCSDHGTCRNNQDFAMTSLRLCTNHRAHTHAHTQTRTYVFTRTYTHGRTQTHTPMHEPMY